MTIVLDESIRALWFVSLEDSDDLLVSVTSEPSGEAKLTMRLRIANSPKPWDQKDRKEWYTAIIPTVAEAIEGARRVTQQVRALNDGAYHELIRGQGESLEPFVDRFLALPFVHSKTVQPDEIVKDGDGWTYKPKET